MDLCAKCVPVRYLPRVSRSLSDLYIFLTVPRRGSRHELHTNLHTLITRRYKGGSHPWESPKQSLTGCPLHTAHCCTPRHDQHCQRVYPGAGGIPPCIPLREAKGGIPPCIHPSGRLEEALYHCSHPNTGCPETALPVSLLASSVGPTGLNLSNLVRTGCKTAEKDTKKRDLFPFWKKGRVKGARRASPITRFTVG